MKGFAMLRIGEVGWIEKDRPVCGPNDAICRPLAIAICTSDVHTVWEGAVGERHNMILGHEGCAEVVEVGSEVRDFKPGDRVLVPAITPNWSSLEAQAGYAMHSGGMLAGWKFSNIKDGVFSEFFHVNDADGNLALMPEGMDIVDACMLSDMVPTGLHGAELADVQFGDTVLVIGIGPVGLMSVAGANLRGASRIIAVGTRPKCVEVAKLYGASDFISYKNGSIEKQALELTDKNEIKDEQSMLQSIIRFGDETAKEIMTSRQDIVDIDIRSSFDDVLKCIVDNNYSRIPVYQGNDDNIRGVLYIKDLLPHLSKPASFRWQSLIRPPYFVPETKKIDDLLREFQANKVHIAIVVDEFGGTSGLVTLEDILEEIVGEINDEYDEEEKTYSKLSYNTYLFEGKTLLSDFCKILKIDDDEFEDVAGDADTLAGLLLELKGDFLSLHEKIDYDNYTFEVMGVERRRISRVKVTVHEKKQDASE